MSDGKGVFHRVKGFPKTARRDEVIGGGYFVFRRGDSTRRVRPSTFPFEYATQEAAAEEAHRLSREQPGYTFEVFGRVSSFLVIPEQSKAA